MSESYPKQGFGIPSGMMAVPGAIIPTPPPLEKRIYYVPSEVDAYTLPVYREGRSVGEVAQQCLPDDEARILPDPDTYTLFDLRRKWQKLGETAISQVFETSPGILADDSLASQEDKEFARRANRTSHRVYRPGVKTIDQKIIAANPKLMARSLLHLMARDEDIETFKTKYTEMYILPKDYEASVRVIPITAAAAWLRAFKDWPEWYWRGFNYVPIEPIQDITPVARTTYAQEVAVTTTNLRGQPFRVVLGFMPQHEDQLYEMREQISTTLTDMFVCHNDLHDRNFVVVPYTHESGTVDLSRCPRLYAIDFESAEIIGDAA